MVAAECGDAGRAVERQVDPVFRPGIGLNDCMAIHKEESDAGLCQYFVQPRKVTALREPYSARAAPKMFLIMKRRHFNLCPHRLMRRAQERKKSVRCAAGDNFQFTSVLKMPKTLYDITAIFFLK